MPFPGNDNESPWVESSIAPNLYFTEASTLSALGWPDEDFTCLACGEAIPSDGMIQEVLDDEVVAWNYACTCGTSMKVYND